tara:strand:- start:17827 stop:18909 length:1083 start_codon:yes stop_codon:yes gene_type:complete
MTWVAAGVAVVGGGIQVAQGIRQQRQGNELENSLDKPEFSIPPEIAKNLSEAEMRAYQGLPDEQKAAFLDNQQRAAQTALRSSGDRRGGLGMISQIQAQQDRSSLGLLQQDVAARDKNILRAQEARNVMASYRDKRFEHEYNEYSSDLDYARAQVGAGMQNVAGGLTTAGSAIQSGIANQEGADGLTRKERRMHEHQTKLNELEKERLRLAGLPPNVSEITTNTELTVDGHDNNYLEHGLPVGYDVPGHPNYGKKKTSEVNNSTSSLLPPSDNIYKQKAIDYHLGSKIEKKRIAKDMLRKASSGDEDAYSWATTNLPEFIEAGNLEVEWSNVFKNYGGKRFQKRGKDMGSYVNVGGVNKY